MIVYQINNLFVLLRLLNKVSFFVFNCYRLMAFSRFCFISQSVWILCRGLLKMNILSFLIMLLCYDFLILFIKKHIFWLVFSLFLWRLFFSLGYYLPDCQLLCRTLESCFIGWSGDLASSVRLKCLQFHRSFFLFYFVGFLVLFRIKSLFWHLHMKFFLHCFVQTVFWALAICLPFDTMVLDDFHLRWLQELLLVF